MQWQPQRAVAVHSVGGYSVCIWQLECVRGVASAASGYTSEEGAAPPGAAGRDVGRPLLRDMEITESRWEQVVDWTCVGSRHARS